MILRVIEWTNECIDQCRCCRRQAVFWLVESVNQRFLAKIVKNVPAVASFQEPQFNESWNVSVSILSVCRKGRVANQEALAERLYQSVGRSAELEAKGKKQSDLMD